MATKNNIKLNTMLVNVQNTSRFIFQEIKTHPVRYSVALSALFLFLMFLIFRANRSHLPIPTTPTMESSVAPTRLPARATMQFDQSNVEVQPGRQFQVTIQLTTRHRTLDGADAVVVFDPEYIRPMDVVRAHGLPEQFKLFQFRLEKNRILITTAKTAVSDEPIDSLDIATLTFRTLKPGVSTLLFEHVPGATYASTAIQSGDSMNILDEVVKTTIVSK